RSTKERDSLRTPPPRELSARCSTRRMVFRRSSRETMPASPLWRLKLAGGAARLAGADVDRDELGHRRPLRIEDGGGSAVLGGLELAGAERSSPPGRALVRSTVCRHGTRLEFPLGASGGSEGIATGLPPTDESTNARRVYGDIGKSCGSWPTGRAPHLSR